MVLNGNCGKKSRVIQNEFCFCFSITLLALSICADRDATLMLYVIVKGSRKFSDSYYI